MLNFLTRPVEKFILVTKNEVFVESTLKKLNDSAGVEMDKSEFKRIGSDFVSIVNDDDLQFIQDKRKMANIPWSRLGKKSQEGKILQYLILFMLFITMVKA